MAEPKSPAPKSPLNWVGLAVIGSELVGATVLGVGLDLAFGTLPWGTVALTLLGFAGAVVLAVRTLGTQSPKP